MGSLFLRGITGKIHYLLELCVVVYSLGGLQIDHSVILGTANPGPVDMALVNKFGVRMFWLLLINVLLVKHTVAGSAKSQHFDTKKQGNGNGNVTAKAKQPSPGKVRKK